MKKNILFILIILLSFFQTCKTTENMKDLKWFEGHWTGSAYQKDVDMSWSIDLSINIEEKIFNISYPSLNCSGYWEIKDFNNEKAYFIERITYGPCIDYINVEFIKTDENKAEVLFYYKSNLKAEGKLKKN